MHAIIKLIKNTHRHPANQALHFIGAPFYAIGLVVIFGNFTGILHQHQQQVTITTMVSVDPIGGGFAMLFAAIAMFVSGHIIEGNVGSMTPVLLFRLLLRKVARYPIAQRIHLLWT
jgi:hypothetical protein